MKFIIRMKGGSGSGNFGHRGREGEVGGSVAEGRSQQRSGMINKIRNLQLMDENSAGYAKKIDDIVSGLGLSNNDIHKVSKSDIPFVLEAIVRFPKSDLDVVWETYDTDDMADRLEQMAMEDGEDIDAYYSAAGIGRLNGDVYEINLHTMTDNEWISGLSLPNVMHNKAGTMVSVAAHEYAHSMDVYDKYSGTSIWYDAIKQSKTVSSYGNTNPKENFAESMALMAIRPAFFRKGYPVLYAAIRDLTGWDPADYSGEYKEYVGQSFDSIVPFREFIVTSSGYHLQLLK